VKEREKKRNEGVSLSFYKLLPLDLIRGKRIKGKENKMETITSSTSSSKIAGGTGETTAVVLRLHRGGEGEKRGGRGEEEAFCPRRHPSLESKGGKRKKKRGNGGHWQFLNSTDLRLLVPRKKKEGGGKKRRKKGTKFSFRSSPYGRKR